MEREVLPPNITDSGIHRRYNETINNKIVEFGAADFADSFLGSHFVDCTIKIRGSAIRTLHTMNNCKFSNCLIWAHKKQVGSTWEADFIGTSFKGRFELRFARKLIDCDFSEAKLSHITFMANKDLKEINGLSYPHIALKDIAQNFKEWDGIVKPNDFKDLVSTEKSLAKMIVMNLDEMTKEPEKMWECIKRLSFVETNHRV